VEEIEDPVGESKKISQNKRYPSTSAKQHYPTYSTVQCMYRKPHQRCMRSPTFMCMSVDFADQRRLSLLLCPWSVRTRGQTIRLASDDQTEKSMDLVGSAPSDDYELDANRGDHVYVQRFERLDKM
jgi:hypothetical protein